MSGKGRRRVRRRRRQWRGMCCEAADMLTMTQGKCRRCFVRVRMDVWSMCRWCCQDCCVEKTTIMCRHSHHSARRDEAAAAPLLTTHARLTATMRAETMTEQRWRLQEAGRIPTCCCRCRCDGATSIVVVVWPSAVTVGQDGAEIVVVAVVVGVAGN